LEQTAAGIPVDKIGLHIISLLSANCRAPYRTIASTVGISTNAVKTRVKKMLAKGIYILSYYPNVAVPYGE
jgi:DNA-binding Lrp family transcriptional regulator